MGQPIESERFGAYERFNLYASIRAADVRAVWWDRLRANPGEFAGTVGSDLLLGHDLLARQLTPAFGERARLLPLAERYPRDDGSPAGDIFRATGLVLDRQPAPAHMSLTVEALTALLRLLGVWGLAALGLWRCWRLVAPIIVALLALSGSLAVVAAAGPSLHVRYLLPFVPYIMLAQAIGVAWIVGVVAERLASARTVRVGAWRRRAPILVESVLLVVVAVAFAVQVLAYPATSDPDPDGYVSYAQRLLEGGRLPSSGRLPGYPLLLALLLRTTPPPLAEAVYWTQAALAAVFLVVCWVAVRRWFGALAALLVVGIFAAPSFFTRMSVVMLPDVPYSVVLLPLLLGVGWWTVTDRPRGGWWWLPVFAIASFALQAVRPTTFGLLAIFAPALVVGLLIGRRTGGGTRLTLPAPAARRAGALLAVAVLVMAAANALLDTGARRQNAEIVAYRVVSRLPAASDSPADMRVEAARRQFAEIEGQPIEEARFGAYERFNLMAAIHPGDAAAVWRDRLAAHPMLYAAAIVEEVRLGHHLLARVAVPFFFDPERYSLFLARYPRNDGTPEGTFFRRTGLIADLARPAVGRYPFEAAAAAAVVEVLTIWGLIGLGCLRAWRQFGPLVTAFVVLLAGFVVAVATTNTVDPRYLLPFAPLVAGAQALGLVGLVEQFLVNRSPAEDAATGATATTTSD
ncbi:MAG: hypothetical protein IT340_08095 [Chloroflexi bacterium]|nr:hypothetical protein [Chloroflexota bacterium]